MTGWWLDASHVGGKHGRSGSSAWELGLGAGRHVHHVSIMRHAFKWFSANGIGQKPFNQVINSECWVSSRQDRNHCVSSESASTKPKRTLLPNASRCSNFPHYVIHPESDVYGRNVYIIYNDHIYNYIYYSYIYEKDRAGSLSRSYFNPRHL